MLLRGLRIYLLMGGWKGEALEAIGHEHPRCDVVHAVSMG